MANVKKVTEFKITIEGTADYLGQVINLISKIEDDLSDEDIQSSNISIEAKETCRAITKV
jgi:hypothetical protein